MGKNWQSAHWEPINIRTTCSSRYGILIGVTGWEKKMFKARKSFVRRNNDVNAVDSRLHWHVTRNQSPTSVHPFPLPADTFGKVWAGRTSIIQPRDTFIQPSTHQRWASLVTFALKMRKVMFWSPCIYLFIYLYACDSHNTKVLNRIAWNLVGWLVIIRGPFD